MTTAYEPTKSSDPAPEMETNAAGGVQGKVDAFLRGLPPLAILEIGRVLHEGALSHEPDPFPEDLTERNWHKIPAGDHLNHLLIHLFKYLTGDTSEKHASHLATRAVMFLEMHLRAQQP